MTGAPALLGWRDIELGAPELAQLGMARLTSAHVALLGTLCRDGSPQISPVEPYLARGQLLVGAIAWSAKADDLRRDPAPAPRIGHAVQAFQQALVTTQVKNRPGPHPAASQHPRTTRALAGRGSRG